MLTDAAPDPTAATSLAALADRCVQCGLCLPHCPTYRLDGVESESPRGRIAYVKAVANGQLPPTLAGDRHLDHCLGCRRCEPVCPAGVQYENLLVAARHAQFDRHKPPAFERAALLALSSPTVWKLAAPLARVSGRLPPIPAPPALPSTTGQTIGNHGRVAIFEGCAARDYERGTRQALAVLLSRAGFEVRPVAGQGCCGTAASHAGDADGALRMAQGNRRAFANHERVLCLATGCQSILTKSLAGVAIVEDALSVLDRKGDRLAFRPAAARVALHLPCSQRVQNGDAAVRRLLARVPQLEVIELPDTGCCGAAGLHMIAEPDRAARLLEPLIVAAEAALATEILSANIGCRLHFGNGAKIPVRHPIDFLAEHLA